MAILHLATDATARSALQRRFRRGELTRVRQGIYVESHDPTEIAATVLKKWSNIAHYVFTEPLVVYRTAVELKPHNNRVYLMADQGQRRTIQVGPLSLTIDAGDTRHGVEPFSIDMKRSNLARQLLENLTSTRTKKGFKYKLGREWVESQLLNELERRGEASLNQLRDETAVLAPLLGLEQQQQDLYKMIAALLKTYEAKGVLTSRASLALVNGEPYDRERIERFEQFANYLNKLDLSEVPYTYESTGWRNLTFYESYFSNYIEGTRFTIAEAEDIAASESALYQRHEDSHDLLAHIEISGDTMDMNHVPNTSAQLLDLIQSRHRLLLAQRPAKRPGEFKIKDNQAGSTLFVSPDWVEGTLVRGFAIYHQLPTGIKRALFLHFLIAEVHPFDDGNGRLARIMMNAELVACDQHKIIVPTVCRDNYLAGLRHATRHQRFRTIVKVLHQLQQYTAALPWSDYNDTKELLLLHAADKEADEGLMKFNRQLSQYSGDYQPG